MTAWRSPYQPGGALTRSGCETGPRGVVSSEEFLAPVQSRKTVVRWEGWVQSPPSSDNVKKERQTIPSHPGEDFCPGKFAMWLASLLGNRLTSARGSQHVRARAEFSHPCSVTDEGGKGSRYRSLSSKVFSLMCSCQKRCKHVCLHSQIQLGASVKINICCTFPGALRWKCNLAAKENLQQPHNLLKSQARVLAPLYWTVARMAQNTAHVGKPRWS